MILQLEIAAILRKTQNPLKIQVHFEWKPLDLPGPLPFRHLPSKHVWILSKVTLRFWDANSALKLSIVFSRNNSWSLFEKEKTSCFQTTAIFWNVTSFFPPILVQFPLYLAKFCGKVMPSGALETLPIPSTKTLWKTPKNHQSHQPNKTLYKLWQTTRTDLFRGDERKKKKHMAICS